MKQYIDIALNYFKKHVTGFAVLLIVIGAAFIVIGHFYTGWIAESFQKLGIAIFTGGIFSVFFKAIQASGVFKDELAQVIYFDENYLKNREDISDIWNRVTRALFKNPFPGIEYKIYNIVKDVYLPSEQEFYYPDLFREYLITWYNKDRGLIKIEIHSSGTISPKAGATSITVGSEYLADPIQELDTDQFSITEIDINNANIFNIEDITVETDGKTGQRVWKYESKTDLTIPTRFKITKIIIQDINTDNSHEFEAKTYVESLKLEINYPHDSLGVEFHGLGLSFKDWGIIRNKVVKKECNDLIFCHQGFKLLFNI